MPAATQKHELTFENVIRWASEEDDGWTVTCAMRGDPDTRYTITLPLEEKTVPEELLTLGAPPGRYSATLEPRTDVTKREWIRRRPRG